MIDLKKYIEILKLLIECNKNSSDEFKQGLARGYRGSLEVLLNTAKE